MRDYLQHFKEYSERKQRQSLQLSTRHIKSLISGCGGQFSRAAVRMRRPIQIIQPTQFLWKCGRWVRFQADSNEFRWPCVGGRTSRGRADNNIPRAYPWEDTLKQEWWRLGALRQFAFKLKSPRVIQTTSKHLQEISSHSDLTENLPPLNNLTKLTAWWG
jgi:hypothetical protein